MSKEYPQFSREVEVDGAIYVIEYDQEVIQIDDPKPCEEHRGRVADMMTQTTIHEITDADDLPLPDNTDIQTLRTKILAVIGDGQPKCPDCFDDEIESDLVPA